MRLYICPFLYFFFLLLQTIGMNHGFRPIYFPYNLNKCESLGKREITVAEFLFQTYILRQWTIFLLNVEKDIGEEQIIQLSINGGDFLAV